MKIRIVAVPPGPAPEWVREGWVGCKLLVAIVPNSKNFEQGVKYGKPENLDGYPVETNEAIEILRKRSPKAARWWKKNIVPEFMPYLVFKKDVCELI